MSGQFSACAERQRLPPGSALGWHAHGPAYAAIVLEGGYEEAGDDGRRTVREGDVVIHTAFSAHQNAISVHGSTVINFRLDPRAALGLRSGRTADPDALVAAFKEDPAQAFDLLGRLAPPASGPDDAPDLLAKALNGVDVPASIEAWAETQKVPARTLRRSFQQLFGLSPASFRTRARARRALAQVISTPAPFAAIAHDLGYADQAHLSRAITQLTGAPPSRWRASGR